MSDATERLRAMLDERGVEHRDATPDILHDVTNWVTKAWLADGRWFRAIETQKGDFTLELFGYSPEQAIEATLGMGECHDSNNRFNAWQCSECGATVLLMFDDYDEPTYSVNGSADVPKYCPNCGKVVRA